jgi:hypothetical protein
MRNTSTLFNPVFLRLILAIACIVCASNIKAQDVVISEYKNIVAVPTGEYTELLVIKDNTDLVGFTLRDNSAGGTWQGGITFKNIPLFKNLRAGTVIVIFHRGINGTPDANTNDGSIILSAEEAYFDKVLFATSDWSANALNIAQSGDMMQLTDPSGNNHHTLGHGPASYRINYFDGIIGPKLFHEISSISFNVFVYPGKSIDDFNMPNPGNAKTLHSAIETPTLPNYSLLPQASENSQYWRQIRAPQWNAPSLTGTISQAGVNLTWNQLVDPYPADQYQGYLIMRGTKTPSAVPQDGKNYVRGDMIGNWEVVASINGTTNTTYLDINPLPCGDTINYRIYGFRYGAPNITIDSIACSQLPYLAKGRSYNETSFATFSATRPLPPTPTITSLGTTAICEGTEVTLKVTSPYPNGTGYQWFKDGAPINGAIANEYKANAPGSYRIRINGANGCAIESNSLSVSTLPKPLAVISQGKEVRICSGDTVQLQAGPIGSTFSWLLNGTLTPITTSNYPATIGGQYQVIAKNDNGCIDTSDITTVVLKTVTIAFPDPKINFGNLDGCKSSTSASNLVRNTGKDTAIITKIDAPNGFQYVSPSLPIILAPGKSATLTFAFTPLQPGESKGDALLQTSTCNAFTTINLRGFKEQASVSQSLTNINYGITLFCNVQPKDTIIIIENKGNADLTITKGLIKSPFQIISPSTFPLTIKPGTNAAISLRYTPSTLENIYTETMLLPYTAGTCIDTLRFSLIGEVRVPPLLGCTNSKDSLFPITNSGKTDITMNAQPTAGLTILTPLPIVIKAGETIMVSVRIEPPTDGQYKGFISFITNECGIKKDYVIRTSKESASYSLSKPTHQFKKLIRCDAQTMLKDSIMITASALGILGEATISDFQIDGPFTTSIVKGDKLSGGSKDFLVMFTPNQEGTFSGKLTVTFEPCAITKTIDLTGTLSSTTYDLTQTSIAFPKTDSGIIEKSIIILVNTGKENIRITSILGFASPFSYVSTKQPSDTIAPGETATITVSYAPNSNSMDSILVALLIDGGDCSKQINIPITGIGNQPKPKDVNGSFDIIGESRIAAPGETVNFPIKIASTTIKDMNIASLSMNISYNHTLLLPKTMRMKQQGITGSMSESTPGILTITTTANDTNARILSGDFLDIECMALLGDAMNTPLTMSNLAFTKRTTGTCSLTVNTPTFTLTDICDLPNRLIKVSGQIALAKKHHVLSVDIVSQDRTILDLFSVDGSLIGHLVDGVISSGNHEIALPQDLPSGMYLAVLRSGRHIRTLSFGHVQ